MSTIVKETESVPVSPEAVQPRAAAGNAAPNESASKPQPVALEVSVTVNGARTVDGSDKREPFAESSKTVLVFGNGAVIRLQSSVAPGQLLFLTNEKTKKEVVCQVVKSKNYRNVSGYVELEFTEPVVGFWGMRFPGDNRVAQPSANATTPALATPIHSSPATGTLAAPSASAPPAPLSSPAIPAAIELPKPAAPAVAETPEPVPPKITAPAQPVSKPISAAPTIATFPPDKPNNATATPSALDLTSLPRASDTKLRAIPAIPAAPSTPASNAPKPEASKSAATDPTEALRAENARLQEQLSALLFQGTKKPAPPVAPASAPESKPLSNLAAKVLDIGAPPASGAPSAKVAPPVAQAPVAAPPAVTPAKVTPFVLPPISKTLAPSKMSTTPLQSLLDEEPVKIPAWLEPLARNSATPAPPEPKLEAESLFESPVLPVVESKVSAVTAHVESPASDLFVRQESAPVADAASSSSFEVPAPTFGSGSMFNDENISEDIASGSKKGVLFAVLAAGIVLAAGGGYWYTHQGAHGSGAAQIAQQNVSQANPSADAPANGVSSLPASTAAQATPATGSANTRTAGIVKDLSATPAPLNTNLVVAPGRSAQPGNASSASSAPVSEPLANQPVPTQSKKALLGAVRLSSPTVSRKGDGQMVGDADLALNSSAVTGDASLGANFASVSGPASPSVPVPIGGDVKSAKLVKAISPVYPAFAKTQRVSGDVKIDALIDAAGHVTTMTVVSGPVMLHQAAMDALRQWKYQPATLDGKSVSMHLTVTLQFRLQ